MTATAENGTIHHHLHRHTIEPPQGAAVDRQTPVPVASIDWDGFDAGTPTHHNANLAKGWLLTALKWTLNNWWTEDRNLDDQSDDTYLDFPGSGSEEKVREPASMALALAVALRTGIYDSEVTGVSKDEALAKALKLIRSIAYRHRVNSGSRGDWSWGWQSALWASHAGFSAWMLWDHLSAQDQAYVKKMVVTEADQYRSPLYYRDREGRTRFPGDSKSEEQAWNAHLLSLASVMMPDHANAPTWKTSSIHLMLSTFSRPEDVSNDTVVHGHRLSEWLDGSNMESDGAVINHYQMHPDYTAAGTVEFNPALMYFLADRPTPIAARHNIDTVMELLVHSDYQVGTRPYRDGVLERKQEVGEPGGTIFRPGTLCPGRYSDDAEVRAASRRCRASSVDAGETFPPGKTRACAQGPPATHANLFFPTGSDWSLMRRPNYANFVAQVDVFDFDTTIDDRTLRGGYWFSCYARDVRAMQARHDDGRTYNDGDNLEYHGREGQSAHYASKAWLAYWIQQQKGTGSFEYENDPYDLEFNRIATYEAEDGDNTLSGTATKVSCDDECSGKHGVRVWDTGKANALTISDINAPRSGFYNLYLIYVNGADTSRELRLTIGGAEYTVNFSVSKRGWNLNVEATKVYLNAGDNDLTIEKLPHDNGRLEPIIDRVVLGRPVDGDPYLPVASSAAVNGTSLVLSYYEVLDPTSRPVAGDFSVSVTDSETGTVSTRRVTGVAVAGSEVTLTLSAAVKSGDTVTLDYTPGTIPIQDLAGNAGTSLDDYPVTNNTPAP